MPTDNPMLELKSRGFLTRLLQRSGGDTGVRLNAGEVGEELGLPLEQTLEIVAALHLRGALHRCGRLNPPRGPEVHLTGRGITEAVRAAA
ncbi:MAG TPA: hypothetical protein VFL93_11065 [Longimicrobiaceae bacterium]|jgi:hypothetical protein|nr:hypothetical protein [Longimicrobiaceae bacterium]